MPYAGAAEPLFELERMRGTQKPAECCGYGGGRRGVMLSTEQAIGVGAEK
jgi:hypothetical protein